MKMVKMVKNDLALEAERVSSGSYHFGFVMQQVLGHISVYRNIRRFVEQDASIAPTWVEVTFHQPGGWIERLPLAPGRVKGAARGVLQVRQGLAKTHHDVLLFNSETPCVYARSRMRQVPSVLMTDMTPHQLDLMAEFYNHPKPGNSPLDRYKHRVILDVYRLARLIVPPTGWAKASLLKDYGVPEEKIVVLPPGVDVDFWAPPSSGVREASLEASGGLPRILFVGGDFERKGGSLLLKWFLSQGQKRCELHMVTRTPPKLSETVPGLHFHTGLEANDPRLVQLYHESHIFALPTLADCFGVASIEAMATGLPVITTNVGGVPDILDDGQQGFLIQPGNDGELADRIERLLAAPLRRKMSAHARKRVEERFNARHNAGRLLELMKGLVASPARA